MLLSMQVTDNLDDGVYKLTVITKYVPDIKVPEADRLSTPPPHLCQLATLSSLLAGLLSFLLASRVG